jgi:Fic family protein
MRLNKSNFYVLLCLLNGGNSASNIVSMLGGQNIRSTQRSLSRLTEFGIVDRYGPSNNPSYEINYKNLVALNIPEKLFYDETRPETKLNEEFLQWLVDNSGDIENIFTHSTITPQELSKKDIEYLTVEFSWKSSALEGNTYTLLDTNLLLTEGVKTGKHTEFETQMIINHKNAIDFIIANQAVFSGSISFAAVEELHKQVGYNLGIGAGVRKRIIRISASNYIPQPVPTKIKESANLALQAINSVSSPYHRALLALAVIPYLQIFEDGNKRTGRLLANAILMSSVGKGFSFRSVNARDLAIAYLMLYEANSMSALHKILSKELK